MSKLTEAHNIQPLDPAFHLMPKDQLDRVFNQDMCDIDGEFLGFTNVYMALASIIPLHWTVIDLGCAYAPQAIIFKDHKAYIGVDASPCERFMADNSTHYTMTTGQFIRDHADSYDADRTFAICSYVPNWCGENSRELVCGKFKNIFTFYPASNPDTRRAALEGRE